MNAPQETITTSLFSAFQPGEKAAVVVSLYIARDFVEPELITAVAFTLHYVTQSVFVFALLSTLVLSFVLLVIAVAFYAIKRTSNQNQDLSREALFFRSQLGQYAACLVLSNWIRGVSEWIDIKWIQDDGVTAG